MKRFFASLATFSLVETIGRHPAIAGTLMLLGVGGGAGIALLTTPTIVPQPASYFNMNGSFGETSNALATNKGVAGPFELPGSSTANGTNSFAIYMEGLVDTNLSNVVDFNEYALGDASAAQGLIVSGGGPGLPQFLVQKFLGGAYWWSAASTNTYNAYVSVGGTATSYNAGYYPFTTSGGGCARQPGGVFISGSYVAVSDPGFLCGTAPTANPAIIPGDGAQQATGAGSISTACVSNSPVSGEMTVTAHVAIAHGIVPAQTYTLQGFTPTGYNATYTALPGTSGTTLVGETTTGGGTCPAAVSVEGTALSGTTATITWPAISTTSPFSTGSGQTGITTHIAQHFCGIIGEDGADSPFPGGQFASFVDDNGNPLPGAPALVPWLNQGTANFTGYTQANTQSPSSPDMTVTAMNAYTITAATYSGTTGYVTFTTSTNPGFIAGSEFTVSGMTATGASINLTYVAVAGTSGTTIVGSPLSGPVGTPQAISSPGTIGLGATPQMVSVIIPGMFVLGVPGAAISPYGTFGGTGTGGAGTYGLVGSPGSYSVTITAITAPSGGLSTLTASAAAGTLTVGQTIILTAYGTNPMVITALGTGSGGAGTYIVSNTNTGSFSGSTAGTASDTLGSSAAPVNIFTYTSTYYTATPSTVPSGGTVTARTQASLGDFINVIGASITGFSTSAHSGWGGALGNVGMLYGVFPQATGGAPSTAALASLCKKQTDIQTFAAANGLTVRSLYRLNDPGIWADSSVAQFTGSISGTALTVASTQYGSTSAMGSGTTIAGAGITGCPLSCPTISSGSGSSYTLSASGGTVASEAMAAGAYKVATPTASNSFSGYISGNTLTVTSVPAGASFTGSTYTTFTGSISTAGVLTVSGPTTGGAVVGVGTTITGSGVPTGEVVTSLRTGLGINGTYNVSPAPTSAVGSETLYGGGTLAGQATILIVSGVSGTIAAGMVVTDGGASITGPPILITGGSTTTWAITPNYYPAISNDTTMVGTNTTLVPGQYVLNSGIATPVKIIGYGTGAGGVGTYTLSNSANGSIGSSGSPVALTSTSISDGGATAPGPALTITDLGPGVTFPVTSYGSGSFGSYSGTGSLFLSGTFDASVLGGTPSSIQAQVSTTAGGSPISGCTACAWTSLASYSTTPFTFTAAITTGGAMTVPIGTPQPSVGNAFSGAGYSGTVTAATAPGVFTVSPSPGSAIASETMTASTVFNWSGQALGIVAGGPYYVSVRAANGTAYATLPNLIKVGLVFNLWGEGQLGSLLSGTGGYGMSYFTGLWGLNELQSGLDAGPPIVSNYVPTQTVMIAGDRFGVSGSLTPFLAEGIGNFDQGLVNAFGWPVGITSGDRDGVGTEPLTLGNVANSQTIGVGDGSTTAWCSSTKFCSNASVSGYLFYNVASLTGASLANATISGATLTVPAGSGTPTTTGLISGALAPGLILNVAGSPTLTTCLTGCLPGAYGNPPGAQSWALSASASGTPTRADPVGGAPWPSYNIQTIGAPPFPAGTSYGVELIKAGTFTVSVNGTVVCQDSQAFAYNNQGGNCTGTGISSSFVNYLTGDYSITFSTPPANNAVITASWTNIISPDGSSNAFGRPQGFDYFGNGSCTSGPVSSYSCKTPGGYSANVFAGSNQDTGPLYDSGYQVGAVGYTQLVSWLYSVKYPNLIPGASASTPFISSGYWRGSGMVYFLTNASCCQDVETFLASQWTLDVATKSTFSGTISGGVLTLSSAASGPMWEGEVVGGTGLTGGIYITGLTGGSWGASGSTYALAGASGVSFTGAMQNAVYYQGPGPAFYVGPLNDNVTQAGNAAAGALPVTGYGPHPGNGFAGGRRIGSRWAAMTWGGFTTPANASDPTLDRTKADASGCDTAALAAPCFDVGNTYAASASGTISGSTITFTGGLSAHARPFVVGQALSCSGCTTGRFITAVSAPPTQSTASGAGQVGNTFTVTANGSLGVSTTETVTAGCSGTSGAGSNCVDVAIKAGTTNGTWATAFALATCGANNLNGSTVNYNVPVGICQDNGIGSIVRNFRIGTQQFIIGSPPGLPYDDGVDQVTSGAYNQSGAFTCNIVAAKVVQCVRNAAYAEGTPVSTGLWSATAWPSASVASATYNSSTGALSLTFSAAPFGASVGSTLDGAQVAISGLAGTGVSALNGTWVITSTASSGTVINLGAPAGLGTLSITSATGTLAAGSGTFIEYGDSVIGTTRTTALMGYVGGQSFPIASAGSGQTPGSYTATATYVTAASATYTSSTGIIAMTFSTAPFGANVGSTINGTNLTITSFAGTGSGALDGYWPITSTASSGTIVNLQGPTGLGTITISNGTGILSACGMISGGYQPKMDIAIGSGGTVINAYPSSAANAMGEGNGTGCTFVVPSSAGGTPGNIAVPLAPVEGIGGIATFNTDNNLMGVQMYDNSGFVGNPLNSFFTNGQGGYFEPGLPVRPWGEFMAAGVSG